MQREVFRCEWGFVGGVEDSSHRLSTNVSNEHFVISQFDGFLSIVVTGFLGLVVRDGYPWFVAFWDSVDLFEGVW